MSSTFLHYHQLQPEDRVTIASLKQQNYSLRAIVRQLKIIGVRFNNWCQSLINPNPNPNPNPLST